MRKRDHRVTLGKDASSLHLRQALSEAGGENGAQQLRDWAALGSLCAAAGWRLTQTAQGLRAICSASSGRAGDAR
jgi:hypothetical protein